MTRVSIPQNFAMRCSSRALIGKGTVCLSNVRDKHLGNLWGGNPSLNRNRTPGLATNSARAIAIAKTKALILAMALEIHCRILLLAMGLAIVYAMLVAMLLALTHP